jgi:hypothetical protein
MRMTEPGLPCSDVLIRPPSPGAKIAPKLILGTEQYGAVEHYFEAVCCTYQ